MSRPSPSSQRRLVPAPAPAPAPVTSPREEATGCGPALADLFKYSSLALFLTLFTAALGLAVTHQTVTGGPYAVHALAGFAVALILQCVFAFKAIGALARLLGKGLTVVWTLAFTVLSGLLALLQAVVQVVPGLDLLLPFMWVLLGVWVLRRLRGSQLNQTPPPRRPTWPPLQFTGPIDSTNPGDRAA